MRPILTASLASLQRRARRPVAGTKVVAMGFTPDTAAGVAYALRAAPGAPASCPPVVPLAPAGTACGDWRMGLQAELTHAERIAFQAAPTAARANGPWRRPTPAATRRAPWRAWREPGGRWPARVTGQYPAGLQPGTATHHRRWPRWCATSTKHSNNVMTQQLLLTLGLQKAAASGSLMPRVACSRNGGRSVGIG